MRNVVKHCIHGLLGGWLTFSSDDRDIVDTEPSSGNVWKMLLGSTNKWFDQDPIVDNTAGRAGALSEPQY